jgi:acetyltransferase-like isoleucine patch superfamily enzyme
MALAPSVGLLMYAANTFQPIGSLASILGFSAACGFAIVLFIFTGVFVFAIFIRIFSWGIKPGNYPAKSFTMMRWLFYSGLYNIAGRLVLSFVPMSFFINIFFKIVGAKMGKNVRINSWFLNDAYLLEIGDNVFVGGKSDVSCHTFENGFLILKNVKIGSDSTIGQRCYISPGVTIGEQCTIGQYCFIRKNKTIPDKTVLSALAGMPIRAVARMEKTGYVRRKDLTRKQLPT